MHSRLSGFDFPSVPSSPPPLPCLAHRDALGARWWVQTRVEGADHVADITLQAGAPGPVSIGLALPLPDWSEQVYTALPGAVYAGNRFDWRPMRYSPCYPAADAGTRARPLVTDLPRLSSEAGQASCLQLLTRDLAFPAFVARWPDGRALMVTTPSPDPLTLWEAVENAAHDHARLDVRDAIAPRSPHQSRPRWLGRARPPAIPSPIPSKNSCVAGSLPSTTASANKRRDVDSRYVNTEARWSRPGNTGTTKLDDFTRHPSTP